jgi:hypothetical protein
MLRAIRLPCAALLALGLGACGTGVSTASFKGEQHAIAQTISNLQADATAGEQHKICTNDLASSIVSHLGGEKGCETAIKNQLVEVDSTSLEIVSIQIGPGGGTARAEVKSTNAGKTRRGTLALLREGGRWKVSGL